MTGAATGPDDKEFAVRPSGDGGPAAVEVGLKGDGFDVVDRGLWRSGHREGGKEESSAGEDETGEHLAASEE